MTTLLRDLKYGVRMMARTPMVSFVAVLSLALGIAANAAMFSIVNAWMFEPFPYQDQDELVLYRTLRQGESMDLAGGVAVPNFVDYLAGGPSVEQGFVYQVEVANLTGLDVPEQLSVIVASPSLFDVLGVPPMLGRGFRSEEGPEGAGNVLVLDYDYWQRQFFGDREVLGRTVTLDGAPFTIIGVMPERFDMVPANVQAYRPSDFAAAMQDRANRRYLAMARLRDGATAAQAQLEIEGLHARLVAEHPDEMRNQEIVVQKAREFFPGPTDTRLVQILTLVTLFGLLIACANVANLLLGRAEERQREVAVRTAMGAGRHRILRQLLTESLLMGAAAGTVGVAMSVWVVGWLRSVMPAEIPRVMQPALAPEVIVATLVLALLTGVVFGLAPAFQSASGDLREALVGGGRGGTAGRRRKRLRNAFVIGEVAVALALLSGSGFLIQAFDRLANDDPGFEAEGLLTFGLSVLEDRYTESADIVTYERELVRVLGELPGVQGVAIMSSLPRARDNARASYTVDGRPEPEPTERPTADFQAVNPEYFATLDIALRQGRLLEESDRADAPPVAVVSEALVRRDFPDQDPIGSQITLQGTSRTIVGVVETILLDRIQLAGRAGEQIYVPVEQYPLANPRFAVRTQGDPSALAADVRRAVWSVEPDQPLALVRPLQDHIDESLAGPQAIGLFLMVMGGIALALAAMGIYGVMSHAVLQQQREIGIRMALGARRGKVVGMVARTGLRLVGIGLLAGLPLAYLMFRGTLVGLNIFDVDLGFGYPLGLSGALVAVALLATILPARRASGVAPVAALKE